MLAKPTIELLVPPEVMSQYHNVTLAVDVMHINGIPMLVTISRNIHFTTMEALPNCNIPTLVKGIKAIATMYKQAGFHITTTLMDGEFEAMHAWQSGRPQDCAFNEMGRDEHISIIERFIHMLKERMRVIYNSLLFTNMPLWIVIKMAKHAMYWLNVFPHSNGVSNNLSP